MKCFPDPRTDEKYCRLGFSRADLSMKITIGDVSIRAVPHPFKGAALIFTSIAPRTVCQYEVSLPEHCSVEQIAGLIYVNIALNFGDSEAMWKAHLQKWGVTLFQ
jgi:hypothetical protein